MRRRKTVPQLVEDDPVFSWLRLRYLDKPLRTPTPTPPCKPFLSLTREEAARERGVDYRGENRKRPEN